MGRQRDTGLRHRLRVHEVGSDESGNGNAGILEEPSGGMAGADDHRRRQRPTRRPRRSRLLEQAGKDKTLTMFSSLVPAILNVTHRQRQQLRRRAPSPRRRQWMSNYGPSRQRCARRELRLEGWRAAAPSDGQLQQRHALRPAPRLAGSIPRWPVTGHRGFFPLTPPPPWADTCRPEHGTTPPADSSC